MLTTPNRERGERDHLWPSSSWRRSGPVHDYADYWRPSRTRKLRVLDLRTGTSKVLVRGGSHAQYVSTGHLLYGVAGTLRAMAFDLSRLDVVGTSAPVLEGVVTTFLGATDARRRGQRNARVHPRRGRWRRTPNRRGRWILKDASPRCPALPVDDYRDVRASPMVRELALATQDDVWIYDYTRATRSKLTTDPASDRSPIWTPDGQHIVFTSNRAGFPRAVQADRRMAPAATN